MLCAENKKKIDDFLDNSSLGNSVIVIYGPTASGKTGLGIEVAKYINSEIISTDSRQIFKYLDIGTGKVTFSESKGIKHHMIDIINPDETYSVGQFKASSEDIINSLHKSNKIPILVGGTGLYIDSLIYDFNIPKVPADLELRKDLEDKALQFGKKYVYDILFDMDPTYAKTLHYNNLNYVIRGIEVKKITGKSKMDFKTDKKLKYNTLFLTPYDGNREFLYDRINSRVQEMFDNGLIEEVRGILNLGFSGDDFGLKTIGYKEVIEYFNGVYTKNELIDLVKKHNRNYAKRQLTWFGKYT